MAVENALKITTFKIPTFTSNHKCTQKPEQFHHNVN